MKRVLISHAVLTNGGDAAMNLALYDEMKSECDIKIACLRANQTTLLYPDYDITQDTEFYFPWNKARILRGLKLYAQAFEKSYASSDVIIAAPGGYLNNYYGCYSHLKRLQTLSSRKKKTGIYSHSIGPLSRKEMAAMRALSDRLEFLFVRDKQSYALLTRRLGIDQKKVSLTNDCAFLISRKPVRSSSTYGLVGISVRDWSFDGNHIIKFRESIVEICQHLNSLGLKIEFLSTCQGVPGYIDDSAAALQIQKTLNSLGVPVIVDTHHHSPNDLMEKMSSYDFFIGTRMHSCILSMISGTPALNISYEFKSKELYNYLNLGDYIFEYGADKEVAIKRLKLFISRLDKIRTFLLDRIPVEREIALQHKQEMMNRICP